MIISFTDAKMNRTDEKVFLLTVVGSLVALQSDVITIDEAEKALFSPYMVKKLKVQCCDEKIIRLIKKGCELEDIASLIPEKYSDTINEMKEDALKLISNYETFDRSFWIE